jgi:hypothetical protein
LFFVVSAVAVPQTEDLGLGAYSNQKGPILMAVDAGLAATQLDNPYVLFILYMGAAKQDQSIVVSRNDVTLVWHDQEFKMPDLMEFKQSYKGEIHDIVFYRPLPKAGIISSWIRLYKFIDDGDFFPALTAKAKLPKNEASLYGDIAFRTKCYFKNPGFRKGDQVLIKVRDKKDASITGEVGVVFK